MGYLKTLVLVMESLEDTKWKRSGSRKKLRQNTYLFATTSPNAPQNNDDRDKIFLSFYAW